MKVILRLLALSVTPTPAILLLMKGMPQNSLNPHFPSTAVLSTSVVAGIFAFFSFNTGKKLREKLISLALCVFVMFVLTLVVSEAVYFAGCAVTFKL